MGSENNNLELQDDISELDTDICVIEEENATPVAQAISQFFSRITTTQKVIALCVILILSLIIGWSPTRWALSNTFDPLLTQKSDQATGAMATVIGVATAVDFIPLDIADQLAAQLFDISGLFIIVIGALITEKVLLGATTVISFGIVLPLACLLGFAYLLLGRVSIKTVATKLAIFAVMFSIAIPASIGVSQLVDGYFEQERAHIESQLNSSAETIGSGVEAEGEDVDDAESDGTIVDDIIDFFSDAAASAANTVTGTFTGLVDSAKVALSSAFTLLVQWIVTTCIVPILTLIGLFAVTKMLFGINVNPAGSVRYVAKGSSKVFRAGSTKLKRATGR